MPVDLTWPLLPGGDPALFVGGACEAVAGRDFDVESMVPAMNLAEDETEDLRRFLACVQEVVDLLLCDVDRWTRTLDVDVADEPFVDAMLADLGNPFAFDLDLAGKRRLARMLVPVYREKGTAPGIVNAIRFFTGIEVTLSYPAFDDVWLLGVGELGPDSLLGTSDSATRYSYRIVAPVVLTDAERDAMTRLATYMHPAHEHLLGITEPPPPPVVPDDWEVGLSLLGEGSVLH